MATVTKSRVLESPGEEACRASKDKQADQDQELMERVRERLRHL